MKVRTPAISMVVLFQYLTMAVALLAATVTTAPQGPPLAVAFEVASVKANRSGLPGGMSEIQSGGRFVVTNEPLRQIIQNAYGVESFRVLGGPGWMTTERFDIDARAGREVPREQLLTMLRTLLTDRFRLVARTDTREVPVFALTRNNGTIGPRLRPASSAECVERGVGSVPAGQLPTCGALRAGPGRISGRSATIARFVQFLSPRVDRVVIDRTALSGLFDVDLEWTPDDARRAAVAQLGGAPTPLDPNLPEISTALREQLGLNLEATRAPVEVLVIESVQQPTEN